MNFETAKNGNTKTARYCKVLYHNKITSISSFNHHWNTMSFSNNYQQLILEDMKDY